MRIPFAIFVAATSLVTALASCSSARGGPREIDVSGRPEPREAVSAPESVSANLTGTWQLNPRAGGQMQGPRGGMPMGGGGGMGGGRPGGPPSGGMPGGRGPEGRGDSGAVAAPERLTIVQTDSSITISQPRRPPLTLYFDGRDVWVPGITPEDLVAMNARWQRGRLVVRRVVSDQRSITETYELSRNGRRLTVRVRMPGGGTEMALAEVRRVYDRVVDSR